MAKPRQSDQPKAQIDLFAVAPPTVAASPYALRNRDRLLAWAEKGIAFGCSTWTYPGWQGSIYMQQYRSQRAFTDECIREYAQIFPTASADFALYDFPNPMRLRRIAEQTGDAFRLCLKVTDRITIHTYPSMPRYGAHAGQRNPDFLNPTLFREAFLTPLAELGAKVGVILFEFSRFDTGTNLNQMQFLAALDDFFAQLPNNFKYAVELRNPAFLNQHHLDLLRRHGVAHVLNNWTQMPPIVEQIRIPGILTAKHAVVRALLKPGRSYAEAVEQFSPYREIQEPNAQARTGIVQTIHSAIGQGVALSVLANNRLEGNAPGTIEGVLELL